MNEHSPLTEDLAELQDRLLDLALQEVVGGIRPPDLSERFAAAHAAQTVEPTKQRLSAPRWGLLALAASLLLIAGAFAVNHIDKRTSVAKAPAARGLARDELKTAPAEAQASLPQIDAKIPSRPESQVAAFDSQVGEQLARRRVESNRSLEESTTSPLSDEILAKQSDSESLVEGIELDAAMPKLAPAVTAAPQAPSAAFNWESGTFAGTPYREGSFSGGVGGGAYGGRAQASSEARLSLTDGPVAHDRLSESESLGRPLYRQQELLRNGRSRFGVGPGVSGDQYAAIHDNPFTETRGEQALSTFSIDVDTASYSNVRQFLTNGQLPPPDAVRLEELINYFDYHYAAPAPNETTPFAAHLEVAGCPWAPTHRLVRIGVKGREVEKTKRPLSNLVFLVDVSGSMAEPNKLPLVRHGLQQLARQLGENDRVAIVVYASTEGLVLESTLGNNQQTILSALDKLEAGGSTAGGAGIQLAYQIAEDHFIPGGVNRVILCTDGDFNVGVTSTAELERMVTQKAKDTKVFLSVLGFGRGNLNDAMMQGIANRGNGEHYYIDTEREAHKVFVDGLSSTLVTIAKDVKIQVEFNPTQVAGYRLLGYENRLLAAQDFNDDTKDAGEIGAGHTVTALYEIIPSGQAVPAATIDPLKYQPAAAAKSEAAFAPTAAPPTAASDELLTLKMRYKQPTGEVSQKLEWPLRDTGATFASSTPDLQFAAAVASFGMLLRNSPHKGDASYNAIIELASPAAKNDPHGYRAEFVDLVRKARDLTAGAPTPH